jgi:hypothetical protein
VEAVQPALVVAIAWPGCGEREVDPVTDRGGDERRAADRAFRTNSLLVLR